jgi:hypothetical protein
MPGVIKVNSHAANTIEEDSAMNYSSLQSGTLSRQQASEFLGVCKTTLDRLDIPRIKIRRRVVFKKSVLENWLDEHTQIMEEDHVV